MQMEDAIRRCYVISSGDVCKFPKGPQPRKHTFSRVPKANRMRVVGGGGAVWARVRGLGRLDWSGLKADLTKQRSTDTGNSLSKFFFDIASGELDCYLSGGPEAWVEVRVQI